MSGSFRPGSDIHPAKLLQHVLSINNGLNMIKLQMGVILSVHPRFDGVVRAVQEEFH